jgi:Rrf2 family protein
MRHGEGNVPLRQIAEEEGISLQYLEQIFGELRRAGLVDSERGARGGYRLARDPASITVGDVVRTLEGPIAPVDCLAGAEECARAEGCLTREAWHRLQQSMTAALDGITLAYLCRGRQEE